MLRELGWFSLQKKGVRGFLTAACLHLQRGYQENEAKLVMVEHGQTTDMNAERIRQDMMKKRTDFMKNSQVVGQVAQRGCAVCILRGSQTIQDRSLSSLVWAQNWLCFGQEVGQVISCVTFKLNNPVITYQPPSVTLRNDRNEPQGFFISCISERGEILNPHLNV